VFNNVLKNYIQSALKLLGFPDDSVTTYDNWCNLYYTSNISKKLPWNRQSHGPDYDAIRRAVFEAVRAYRNGNPEYDFILVDEGQDLDPISFETIKRVSRHVTVCMDHNQRIYENGAGEAEIIRQLGLNKKNMSLLVAYRCCPYVIQLAAQFIDDETERDLYINQSKTDQTERQTPLLYYAANHDDAQRRMLDIIRTRQAKGDRIGIFYYMNKHVYGYVKGLQEAGLDVEVQNPLERGSYKPLDFSSDRPKVLTYHGAKGLTFDTVILSNLTGRSFPNRNVQSLERLMFVGISRATKWVYMSTYLNTDFPLLHKVLHLEGDKCLTVQKAGDKRKKEDSPNGKTNADDLTDFL